MSTNTRIEELEKLLKLAEEFKRGFRQLHPLVQGDFCRMYYHIDEQADLVREAIEETREEMAYERDVELAAYSY